MSFTTLNTFNSNLWKGGVIKPTLYGLSVKSADLNVNAITLNYRYSGVSYVMIDMIGSSGYISSQPRYNVTSNPVTNTITGLDPNTYYNYVLVPYDKNDISGSSYYFNGFTSGSSTFTSISTAITSISTPINYSNLVKPLCTLSKINSFTNTYNTTNKINTNNMTFNMSCTDLSYVIVNVDGTNNIISKPNGSGVINSLLNKIIPFNLPFAIATLTTAYTYNYTITAYNNAGIANPVPSIGSYTNTPVINTNTNGVVTKDTTYYYITYNVNDNIKFNTNISSNYIAELLCIGGGGYFRNRGEGGVGGGGGGGGGAIVTGSTTFNQTSNYTITVGGSGGENTDLNVKTGIDTKIDYLTTNIIIAKAGGCGGFGAGYGHPIINSTGFIGGCGGGGSGGFGQGIINGDKSQPGYPGGTCLNVLYGANGIAGSINVYTSGKYYAGSGGAGGSFSKTWSINNQIYSSTGGLGSIVSVSSVTWPTYSSAGKAIIAFLAQ